MFCEDMEKKQTNQYSYVGFFAFLLLLLDILIVVVGVQY